MYHLIYSALSFIHLTSYALAKYAFKKPRVRVNAKHLKQ